MNSRDKLLKLMQENPELPIVFCCSSDEIDDCYAWMFYEDFGCDICDIYKTDDRIYDHIVDITEHYQYLYEDDDLPEEEWNEKIQKLVEETPHYKAIRIYCKF